jgi:hypothetical protein
MLDTSGSHEFEDVHAAPESDGVRTLIHVQLGLLALTPFGMWLRFWLRH